MSSSLIRDLGYEGLFWLCAIIFVGVFLYKWIGWIFSSSSEDARGIIYSSSRVFFTWYLLGPGIFLAGLWMALKGYRELQIGFYVVWGVVVLMVYAFEDQFRVFVKGKELHLYNFIGQRLVITAEEIEGFGGFSHKLGVYDVRVFLKETNLKRKSIKILPGFAGVGKVSADSIVKELNTHFGCRRKQG